MSRMDAATLRQLLRDERLLPVVRAPDAGHAVELGTVLAEAGFRLLEITCTVPDVTTAIRELRARLPDEVVVGAGTVRTAGQLERCVAAGASFVVTPGVTRALLPALVGAEVPVVPGVGTASEVMEVLEVGLDLVKLFPARECSPTVIGDLRGPFPELDVVPTGGVAVADLGAWLGAGALAVGLGGQLCSARDLARRDWSRVRDAAASARAVIAEARS